MRLLQGNFESYRALEEFQTASPPGLDRLPLRPLIAASVILALVIGTAGYLRTAWKAKQQTPPVASAPVARVDAQSGGEDAQVVVPGLQPDAIQHAQSVERLVGQAVADLRAAETALDKVRPFARSEVDDADEKVRSAHRHLEAAAAQLKVVQALVSHK